MVKIVYKDTKNNRKSTKTTSMTVG